MKEFICTKCGYVGKPKRHIKGSVLIEIFLWLFFIISIFINLFLCVFLIISASIYSYWRLSGERVCLDCKSPNMIPADSPMGIKFISENNIKQL